MSMRKERFCLEIWNRGHFYGYVKDKKGKKKVWTSRSAADKAAAQANKGQSMSGPGYTVARTNPKPQGIITAAYGSDPMELGYMHDLYSWWTGTHEEIVDEAVFADVTRRLMQPYGIDFIEGVDLKTGEEADQDFWLGELLDAATREGVEHDDVQGYFGKILG